MKFSFLGIDFSITRKKLKELLTLEDINYANDEILEYIRGLTKDDIDIRIRNVTCSLDEDVKKIKEIIKENGIVIIPNFIPENLIHKLSEDIGEVKKMVKLFIKSGRSFKEERDVLFQQDESKVKGYRALSNYNKSIVNVRGGQDNGMVDIFNINKWYSSFENTLIPYYNHKIINNIILDQNKSIEIKNLNLYLNNGLIKTRGFHVDAYAKQMKSFIYLEDCLKLECGPYTYVKKSHLDSPFTKINKKISTGLWKETETPIILRENIVPALAKKGTMVISDQGGSHRGFPQAEGYNRTVAVMKFE